MAKRLGVMKKKVMKPQRPSRAWRDGFHLKIDDAERKLMSPQRTHAPHAATDALTAAPSLPTASHTGAPVPLLVGYGLVAVAALGGMIVVALHWRKWSGGLFEARTTRAGRGSKVAAHG